MDLFAKCHLKLHVNITLSSATNQSTFSYKTVVRQNAAKKTHSVSGYGFVETPEDWQMRMSRMNAYSGCTIRNNKHAEWRQSNRVAAADTNRHRLAW